MEREFSVTGLCVPHKHYMVDISNKIFENLLVEYFADLNKFDVVV